MEDQFVPWEIEAKLITLKFDRDKRVYLSDDRHNKEEGRTGILWQQAFDWFREKHKLHSTIPLPINKVDFAYEITNISEFIEEGQLASMQGGIIYTYKEAREACLIKLIELCQRRSTEL